MLSLPSPEDIPSIVRRLEMVTIGCQVGLFVRLHKCPSSMLAASDLFYEINCHCIDLDGSNDITSA